MRKISIGHTPDTDDAFMFYALLNSKISLHELCFEDFIEPITVLNEQAVLGYYDMTAVSVGYLSRIAKEYHVLTTGACMAEQRGPVLVLRKKNSGKRIAVPGLNTTGYYTLRLFDRQMVCQQVPFNRILSSVINGEYDGGVIISEDQMRIDSSLLEVIDLGQWWYSETGLPLPLGVDVVKSEFSKEIKNKINTVFKSSIEYALRNTDEALTFAIQYGRNIDMTRAKEFIHTFVNQYTCDLKERGKKSIRFFLEKCEQSKLLYNKYSLIFIDEI